MRRFPWILALLTALLIGCDRSTPSQSNQPANNPETTPRVVVLSPALAVIMRDLGGADLVVGRHAYDLALDPSVPICGDQNGIDYEALLRTKPTNILIEWGDRPLPARLVALADDHGWSIDNMTLHELDDIEAACRFIHDRFVVARHTHDSNTGCVFEPPAWDETNWYARMHAAWSQRDLSGAGRILILMSTNPPGALGPGSFHHQILMRIGATPAIADGSPYMSLDAEDILRLAPDGIVLVIPSNGTSPADAQINLGPLATLDIPANRAGRVALIDHPLALTPSTAMVDFADELASILEQWASATPDSAAGG
jgi:ABC-type Fe3+-hydroxamate transport system substrate-binding protein